MGNHNTALYWEYDTRVGRRWNTDPKPQISISDYAVLGLNPISKSDILGDVVKTTTEGANITIQGTNALLKGDQKAGMPNLANPLSYDSETGTLKYNEDIDISAYTDVQKEVLGNYRTLINDNTITTLHIVNPDENVVQRDDGSITSLNKIGANGLTNSHYAIGSDGKVFVQSTDVYLSRTPMKKYTDGSIRRFDGQSHQVTQLARPETAGFVNIHELAGHAFINLIRPFQLATQGKDRNNNNKYVERLMRRVSESFDVDGNKKWFKGSVDEHARYPE